MAIGIALCLLIIGTVLFFARRHGETGVVDSLRALVTDTKKAIENWCGDQLLAVARGHLNPDVSFDSLVYEYPATVVLSNFRLSSEGITIVEASSLRVELTEIPESGKPIVIQTVELFDPTVRLIRRPDGGLVGFSNLLRRAGSASTTQADRPRLSDVFAIRRLGVVNGSMEYQVPDRPPMTLHQLTFDLASKPADGASEAGWYTIDAQFARAPVFLCELYGRLNIDSAVLAISESTVRMALNESQYSTLPPQLQSFVREHEMTGDLSIRMNGEIPLRRGSDMRLDFSTRLTGGHMALGDYVLPVQSLDISGLLSERTLTIQPLEYRGLGGSLVMNGSATLSEPYSAQMSIDMKGVRIEDALRPPADAPPKYAGEIDLTANVTAKLRSLEQSLSGMGKLAVGKGRLVNLPAVRKLTEIATRVTGETGPNDRGTADVRLSGDRVELTNIDFVSGLLAVRGEGSIHFDSTLNFRLNAGPFERVQGQLGQVGRWLAKVTDKLVAYYVRGTLAEPVVSVKPLDLRGSEGQ